MTLRYKGIPALVVTCAFAMFAVAAIPTHAKAYYYNDAVDTAVCGYNTYCGNGFWSNDTYYTNKMYQPVSYYYPQQYYVSYPQVYTYTYPQTIVQRPRRQSASSDTFYRDWIRAEQEWDAIMNYWNRQ